jgi:hypothetical protein
MTQLPGNQALQFCIREAVGRIAVTQARAEDLSQLQELALTKIGRIGATTGSACKDSFGGLDQEVVCSFNEQLTVVLRLTPDSPMVRGSVYIDQIVGLGGWDHLVVEQLKDMINHQQFGSPVRLIRAFQSELERLQSEEGLVLPGTPTLPSRQPKARSATVAPDVEETATNPKKSIN